VDDGQPVRDREREEKESEDDDLGDWVNLPSDTLKVTEEDITSFTQSANPVLIVNCSLTKRLLSPKAKRP